ncbi:TIGR03749 family integrating conjugative element protein [Vibrio metschnikovii]|nr:TIGR03749 family integrating conjugative element protein [Vibrio metschnikovii]
MITQRLKVLVGLFLVLLPLHINASTEVLVWDKRPLNIQLEVGKERIIEFPDNIELQMPRQVHNRLRINSAAGIAYITAIAPFPNSRISATLVGTNEKVFIDLLAIDPKDSDGDITDYVKIVTNEFKQEKQRQRDELFSQSGRVSIRELIQYASHQFFAPPRLRKTGLPIQESIITRPLNLNIMFMGSSAGMFELKPLIQYRTVNYTLTAILLTNKTHTAQPILYRDAHPSFIAVSSQHKDVGPKGSQAQSTILYLVTERPLNDDAVYSPRSWSNNASLQTDSP